MSSKYIPKSRVSNVPKSTINVNNSEDIWWSMGKSEEDIAQEKEYQKEVIKLKSEKQRIESIPLENLTFRDLYQFPFHSAEYGSWVYDNNSNFIFQFEFNNKETRSKTIDILNGDLTDYKKQNVTYKDGEISIDGQLFILIRGFGNLCGIGGYNLDVEYACKIQDSLAEYIVKKLAK